MAGGVSVRDFIVEFLKKEVVGPDPGFPAVQLNGEEIIREAPRIRYGAGILFPKKASHVTQAIGTESEVPESAGGVEDAAEKEKDLLEDEEKFAEAPDEVEQEVSLANEYLPSAMGLSALLKVPEELNVEVSCARYIPGELRGLPGRIPNRVWFRRPLKAVVKISGSRLMSGEIDAFSEEIIIEDEKLPLRLHVVTRRYPPHERETKYRLITLTLVNDNICEGSSPRDEDCFFQTGFRATATDGSACFVPYPDQTFDEEDEEARSLYLLYRHRTVFSVGHGCAANWIENEGKGTAVAVTTETVPSYEVKPVTPRQIASLKLSMHQFASGSKENTIEMCTELANAYQKWILEQGRIAKADSSLTPALKETATSHLDECQRCLDRIKEGIKVLTKEAVAMQAFRLMNRAMLMQQIHYKISTDGARNWIYEEESNQWILNRTYEAPDYKPTAERDPSWYPFQLGFILMNISSIVDPESADRELVDLIWFPTGGGKTEAYLGLSAYVLFLRRLKGERSDSTAVLMRYTLRLLTTQQFQRASSLICACEMMRRNRELDLPECAPFSIGLWVGGDVTPNRCADATAALNELSRTGRDNKFIITSCPWCGCQMGPIWTKGKRAVKGYIKKSGRVLLRCEDESCPFYEGGGLPVCVVDEELYDSPPSLLIGTVDKFAMIPWEPRSGVFFGLGQGAENAPPDLIIQDELHLISGPLGSMVGLYEPLIDLLTSRGKMRTKIIGSTATISRAAEQIKALYGRESVLFPAQGLVAGDSFFALEDKDATGRLYVGIFGSAYSSHATSQVRTMSSLLQSVKMLDVKPEEIDPYWTLLGYFNSLRELGHAVTLVGGDIAEYIGYICDRYGFSWRYTQERNLPVRDIVLEEELTGRVNSTELPAKLKQLFAKYDGGKYSAIDVCFATNMIQVGLDVSRLSLMAVVGQPKTTSEYIQASSRVGRKLPGLVMVNYNPAKPRDRSHYERFRQYHQSIYRYVEPTSVTPFAIPVRERALHALVIGLVRLWGHNSIRIAPTGDLNESLIKKVTEAILERVSAAESEEELGTKDMINAIFERWERAPANEYGRFGMTEEEPIPMMYPPGATPHLSWMERSYETPNNMRNVDSECEGTILLSGQYPTADGRQE